MLSRQSRGLNADSSDEKDEGVSQGNPASLEQLRKKVEELTSQNADLVIKVQVQSLSVKRSRIHRQTMPTKHQITGVHTYKTLT